MRPLLRPVLPALLLLALACGGATTRGPTEQQGIDAWRGPDGTIVDVIADLTPVHRRGGPGIGCESSEVLVTPPLVRFEASDLVEPALHLQVRGSPGLEARALYAPRVPMESRERALEEARAQLLLHCFDASGRRLAVRWEPPGTDPAAPGLWPWAVAELGPSPRWLPDAPAELTCAEAASR